MTQPAIPALVVLTGFMGTGKTTVGAALARVLGYRLVDTDELIVSRHGPIDEIFASRGEDAFRALEADVAAELSAEHRIVVATGGRLMLDPQNADALGRRGRVFCLTAPADVIVDRVLRDSDGPARPLLAGPDPRAAVRVLLAERAAGYGAFESVDADRPVAAIVSDIVHRLAVGASPAR